MPSLLLCLVRELNPHLFSVSELTMQRGGGGGEYGGGEYGSNREYGGGGDRNGDASRGGRNERERRDYEYGGNRQNGSNKSSAISESIFKVGFDSISS